MKKHGWLMCLLLTLQVLGGLEQARAGVVLKPNGQNAIPLRVKSVVARASIRDGFSNTTSVTTFANETGRRIEADFLMTVPEGAVVTYFAYWFGEEKVVARIVDKERAAAIYQHITSRMRDPALVEMIGRNTFRARIFPVMPNADLKVEMRWAEVLDSTPTGLKYLFPLAPDEPGKGILDTLDFEVDVEPSAMGAFGPTIVRARNSYGQPIARQDGRLKVALKQTSFQPTKDFELILDHRDSAPPTLRASMFSARAGGRDGFFALALTANRAVKRPRMKIRGVSTYDLSPRVLPSMKAGQQVLVCGRYRGSGAGTIEMAGVGSAGLQFGAKAEPNNLATKLWAARRLEELSRSETNREAALRISHLFTLPSKWSSWLAVPREELQRFKQEKLQAEMQVLGRRYALEVAKSGQKSRRAQALKKQFEAMRAQAQYGSSAEQYISQVAYELEQQRAVEAAKERPNRRLIARLQRQVQVLNKISNDPSRRYDVLSAQMSALSQELVREEMRKGGQTRRAKHLRARMQSTAQKFEYPMDWNDYHERAKYDKASQLASNYVRSRYEKADARATQRASQQMVNLLGTKLAREQIDRARQAWASQRVARFAAQLAEEKSLERPDVRKVNALEAQIARTEKQNGASLRPAREQAQVQWAYSKLPTLADELVRAKYAQSPEAGRIASIEARINRVAKVVPRGQLYASEEYPLLRLMFETQQAYVTELKRPRLDRKALQVLEERMASVYADPRYKGVAADWSTPNLATIDKSQNPLHKPKIAELKRDLENLDAVLRGQPDAEQSTLLAQSRREKIERLAYATRYHLRLGDPLIAIDAPRDAKQVIAVMPDGQVKRLLWDEAARRWEARFDIPAHAREGAYRIVVIVVEQSGARRERTVDYSVDMSPPRGQAQAQSVTADAARPTLRLEILGDKDTARVFALLPWNEKIELKLSPTGHNRFFALAPVPEGQEQPTQVLYILTDRAHNRTTITVDVKR